MRTQLIDESVRSLNTLASVKTDVSRIPDLRLTEVQGSIMESLRCRLESLSEGPPEDMIEESALGELLAASGPYNGEAKHLASYDAEKIKML